jgi:hypothetical protein
VARGLEHSQYENRILVLRDMFPFTCSLEIFEEIAPMTIQELYHLKVAAVKRWNAMLI